MKKLILKMIVFAAVFVASLILISKLLNAGHDNMTWDTLPASLPLVTMEKEGILYNTLHGYTTPMDVTLQRETVTVLDTGRSTNICVETFESGVTGIGYEVRTLDGTRLIEDSAVTEYETKSGKIRCTVTLKDLLEANKEYSLIFKLTLEDGRVARYYTRAIWAEKLYTLEKIDFVTNFHDCTFDGERLEEITRYLEPNSKLESNKSFHKVNIHSSLKQVAYGTLGVQEIGDPRVTLTQIDSSTATFLIDSVVTDPEDEQSANYRVQEYFRIRYGTDRTYLLDYERTMTQIPRNEVLYANDKFLLGIADEAVDMRETEDGNVLVFETCNKLYGYNVKDNKLIEVFGFYDDGSLDERTNYDHHGIKILEITPEGDITFAVYGYMNRGRHEGECGVQVSTYSSKHNTVEEMVYIPSDKPYSAIAAEVENLLYKNEEGKLYLQFEGTVVCVDLEERTSKVLIQTVRDGMLHVSADHETLVWTEKEDYYHSRELKIMNLSTGLDHTVFSTPQDSLLPLGFMGEDIIYGVAHNDDIRKESSGHIFFPMYKVVICDPHGVTLKEYQQDNIYVTGIEIAANQITLTCLKKQDNGKYVDAMQDHITGNEETVPGKNTVVSADIERYERYVQIKVKKEIDAKNIMLLNPKEVVYEGGRSLELAENRLAKRFYAFGHYGIEAVCSSAANALQTASEQNGFVVDTAGNEIWRKEIRSTKNQIMAFKETKAEADQTSLSVCLDLIFTFKGQVVDSVGLLEEGQSALEILENNLDASHVLDLKGCSLASVLYYVDHELPILALLEDGSAVLITGYNEQNTVILNPAAGTLAKKGMNDSTEWFELSGNNFITYIP